MDLWNVVQVRTRSKVLPNQLTSQPLPPTRTGQALTQNLLQMLRNLPSAFLYCDSYKKNLYNEISHLKVTEWPS